MENRYQTGEINSVDDYKDLLLGVKNHKARVQVLKSHALFERAMNDCMVRSKNSRISRGPRETLEDFIGENETKKTIEEIRAAIEKSGHADMIKWFVKNCFLPKDNKKVTFVIHG